MLGISMRLAAVLAVATCAVAAPTAASSSVDRVHGRTLANAGLHLALGTGTYGPGCTTTGVCDDRSFRFQLAAVAGPAGSPAFGYFARTRVANGNSFSGPVTCMTVADGKAAVGGYATPPDGSPATPFLVYVTDNSQPGGADGISQFWIFGPDEQLPAPGFPFTCPAPESPTGFFPLTGGSVLIH